MATLLSYALTNVNDVKESLGIDAGDTSKDNLIIRKINQATLYIESYCSLSRDHHFALTTYTNEEYDGTNNSTIVLRMRPVTAITSFQRRDSTLSDGSFDDVESELYYKDLNAGVIELVTRSNSGWNRYRVTYTAGYATIPADLAEACVTLACYYVENSASGTAVKKKQEGQRSIEYFQAGTSGSGDSLIDQLGVDDVLARYKQYNLSDSL
jgi:hypothetical protein